MWVSVFSRFTPLGGRVTGGTQVGGGVCVSITDGIEESFMELRDREYKDEWVMDSWMMDG